MVQAMLAAAEESTRFILPDRHELIWGSIAFVLLFGALAIFAFPKMKKTMEARTERIQGQLAAADKAKGEADRMIEEYRARLANAQAEANRIIEEGRKTAESLRRDIVARAETEAGEIVARARGEVGAEKERAMAELRTNVADLSIRVAEKVVARELSSEASQRAFVDQTIAELSRMGNGRN